MEAFITGLGLSSSAGLNAYLPLVLLSLAQQSGAIELQGSLPEALTSVPALVAWIILLIVEMTVDKVPGIDTANDVIATVIRPAAGTALMYASLSGLDANLDPSVITAISILAGGTSAGGVHATKAVTRPAVTLSTGGLGNAVVSVIEDIISFIIALFALVLPFIIIIFVMSFVFLVPWWLWEQHRLSSLRQRGLVR